jgi:hypothetical protein
MRPSYDSILSSDPTSRRRAANQTLSSDGRHSRRRVSAALALVGLGGNDEDGWGQ